MAFGVLVEAVDAEFSLVVDLWVVVFDGDVCVVELLELLVGEEGAGVLYFGFAAQPVDEVFWEFLGQVALLVGDEEFVFSKGSEGKGLLLSLLGGGVGGGVVGCIGIG